MAEHTRWYGRHDDAATHRDARRPDGHAPERYAPREYLDDRGSYYPSPPPSPASSSRAGGGAMSLSSMMDPEPPARRAPATRVPVRDEPAPAYGPSSSSRPSGMPRHAHGRSRSPDYAPARVVARPAPAPAPARSPEKPAPAPLKRALSSKTSLVNPLLSPPAGVVPSARSSWFTCPSIRHNLREHGGADARREPRLCLVVVQQPTDALGVGDGAAVFKQARNVPLDPPPICQLVTEHPDGCSYLQLPEVSLRAHLVEADAPCAPVQPRVNNEAPLINGIHESAFVAPVTTTAVQSLFIFTEIGVRCAGKYRLRFDLVDRVGLSFKRLASVYTDVFQVHGDRRDFPGLQRSTDLMRAVARRGLKVRIIDAQPSKGAKRRRIDAPQEMARVVEDRAVEERGAARDPYPYAPRGQPQPPPLPPLWRTSEPYMPPPPHTSSSWRSLQSTDPRAPPYASQSGGSLRDAPEAVLSPQAGSTWSAPSYAPSTFMSEHSARSSSSTSSMSPQEPHYRPLYSSTAPMHSPERREALPYNAPRPPSTSSRGNVRAAEESDLHAEPPGSIFAHSSRPGRPTYHTHASSAPSPEISRFTTAAADAAPRLLPVLSSLHADASDASERRGSQRPPALELARPYHPGDRPYPSDERPYFLSRPFRPSRIL